MIWTNAEWFSDTENTTDPMRMVIDVGGTEYMHYQRDPLDPTDILIFGPSVYVAGVGASTTAKLKVRTVADLQDQNNARILCLRLDAFEDHFGKRDNTTNTTLTATDTLVELTTTTKVTATAAPREWIIFGGCVYDVGDDSKSLKRQMTYELDGGGENVFAGINNQPDISQGADTSEELFATIAGTVASVGNGVSMDIDLNGAEQYDVTPNGSMNDTFIAAWTWELAASAGGAVVNRVLTTTSVVTDAIPGTVAKRFRSLGDSLSLSDNLQNPLETVRLLINNAELNELIISTYSTKKPGDEISVAEFVFLHAAFGRIVAENFSVNDSLLIMQDLDRVLEETVQITDAIVLVHEFFRQTVDVLATSDGFQKQIVRDGDIVSDKVLSEDIQILDSRIVTVSGIHVRQLTDTISINEMVELLNTKVKDEALTILDASDLIRYMNRVLIDDIDVVDDRIVGRGALTSTRTLTDSISLIDLIDIEFTSGKSRAGKILHGIEFT